MPHDVCHERPIELHMARGALRGYLPTTPTRRTLDELNQNSRAFLTVIEPETSGAEWPQPPSELTINKATILMLRELASAPVQTGTQFARFTRAAIALRVGPFTIQGFMHVPPGGHPMKRLDHDPHPFIAMTSVLVTGPEAEFTVPFLAVNRSHVTLAWQIGASERIPEIESAALDIPLIDV